ncbi:molecular chaperone [Chloroflexota bacterium]
MAGTIVIEEDIARMLIYRFLGQAFSYPETAFKDILLKDGMWDELKAADDVLDIGAEQTITEMHNFISQHNNDPQKLLTDLQIEYTYLFINAVPNVPAPPYESVYFGEGLLMGAPVSRVLHLYREVGLIISESYDALPDHIGAELEFMFYLVQQETRAKQMDERETADTWREKQSHFLSKHLLQWSSPFMTRVTQNARMPFYRLLAELLGAFFNTERKLISLEEAKV